MFLRSYGLAEVYMSDFDLSGYQICHLDDDMHSVLYEQRVIHGMTQKQVAENAKITLQQYQKFESGARNIMTCSFRIACRVIEALEMNISDFYHGEYVIGEEVYLVGKKLYYKKTNRPVDEDVTDE
jgi:transcriptional regulator with XRE-family HTH domain